MQKKVLIRLIIFQYFKQLFIKYFTKFQNIKKLKKDLTKSTIKFTVFSCADLNTLYHATFKNNTLYFCKLDGFNWMVREAVVFGREVGLSYVPALFN